MHQSASVMMTYDIYVIPHVGVHQTVSVMMGDRIVKCVSALLNDKKGQDLSNGICHECELNSQGEITNID